MKVAIEGCSHGELDNIYASILKAEQQGNFKTDLLLLCGDFQAIRNVADLDCLAVPLKYRELGGFHKYYSGETVAPLLTIVIGGNHEASNYMWELYHGGWLAPNIYFLGQAGVIDVGGLIIAGVSGIYKSHDYHRGRFERMPYDNSSIRSVYHTRDYDIWRLKLLASCSASRPDIVLSHDWPNTIEQHGDTAALVKRKPFFKDEIQTSTLGSPPLLELLQTLKPPYWFSAHLHVKFAALFRHRPSNAELAAPNRDITSGSRYGRYEASSSNDPSRGNPEAIDIEFDDDDDDDDDGKDDDCESRTEVPPPANQDVVSMSDVGTSPAGGADRVVESPHTNEAEKDDSHQDEVSEKLPRSSLGATRFLALSKCLPGQDFLQFVDVAPRGSHDSRNEPPTTSPTAQDQRSFPPLRFVPQWLAILRATNHLLSLTRQSKPLPAVTDPALLLRIEEEAAWVSRELQGQAGEDSLAIGRIQRFVHTAPTAFSPCGSQRGPPPWYTNPQTEALTRWLHIENKINPPPPATRTLPVGPAYSGPSDTMRPLHKPVSTVAADEEAEIMKIEAAAAQASRARKRLKGEEGNMPGLVTLEEDESIDARWKEGTG